MINGFVSYKYIISKLYRDLNLNEEINESSVIEWIGEALSMIGAFSQYEEVPICLKLIGGKACLPLGFEKLVDISYKGHPLYWATLTNYHNYRSDNCKTLYCNNKCERTFYVNNNYIITNINNDTNIEDNINIVYLGIPVDDEGIPMIPDDVYYFKAIAAYVTHMLDYADWRRGKTTDKVYEESKINWLFYVNSARGSANMMNTQQLESMKNSIKRLLDFPNDYKSGFRNFNKPTDINLSR